MKTQTCTTRGVTLIELLVTVAILSIILAGIYGLVNSAYESYNHSRAKLESQQTARIVLDYLVYRLREVDGGKSTGKPWNCLACHEKNMDSNDADHALMPCTQDVTIPQKAPAIVELKTLTAVELPPLPAGEIPADFQQMDGNYIRFQADLLPLHGFNESFTDAPSGTYDNDAWDWTAGNASWDTDLDNNYDHGEPELLEDMNDNNAYDYFGETWTLQLRKSDEGPYYELIESLNFNSLYPRTFKSNGKLLYDNSLYDASGYTDIPVAYGIVGLRIRKVLRYPTTASYPTDTRRVIGCSSSSSATACHGSTATTNIYGDANNFSYAQFLATHSFWNTAGLSIEVTATDTKGKYDQFTRLRDFVNFRNIEVNQ